MELVNSKQVFIRNRNGEHVPPVFEVRENWPNDKGCFFNLKIDSPRYQQALPLIYDGKPHRYAESYLGGGLTPECNRLLSQMRKENKVSKLKEALKREN